MGDNMQATVEKIAKAGLDWAMVELGLYPQGDSWQGFWPGHSDPLVVTPGGNCIQMGKYLPPFPDGAPYDFPALIGKWNVQNFSYDFVHWYLLPKPEVYDDYRSILEQVASRLSVTTEVTPGGGTSAGSLDSGNGDLDAQLVYLNSKVGGWEGTAMDTLLAYTSRLPSVIRGQKSIACLLGAALTAEQEVFRRANADALAIATAVLSVMEARGTDAGSGGIDLSIVGAVLSGASLFFTAGTSAAVIGGASAALGALDPFLPKEKAETDAHKAFGADGPDAVVGRMREALTALSDTIGREEMILKDSLRAARGAIYGDYEEYDLSQRPTFVKNTPAENSNPDVIDVEPPILGFMGAAVMPEIAAPLTEVSGTIDGCSNQGVWYRSGDIGYDEYGSAADWMALADIFVMATSGTAGNLVDMGQAMEDVAARFIDVDQTIAQEYGEASTQLGIGDDD